MRRLSYVAPAWGPVTRLLYRYRVLHLMGLIRTFYWRFLRSGRAYGRHIELAEWEWSGKRLPAGERDERVRELKAGVPW